MAASLNNFGRLCQIKGDLNAAESYYTEALETFRGLRKNDEIAEVLDNLGYVLALKDRNREAIAAYSEELEIQRGLYGEHHPKTAKTLVNLASAYGFYGEWEKHEALHRQALEILQKFYDEGNLDAIMSLSRLAFVIIRRDEAEAERLMKKVLDLRRKYLGENHPDVGWSLFDLSFLNAERGDYAEAERLARKTLGMRGRVLTDEHPVTGSALLLLGRSLLAQGDAQGARPALEECLALRRKTLGENHWLLAIANSFYGECLMRLGETERGQRLLFESYDSLLEKLGAENDQTRAALERLRKFFPAQ